MRYQVIDAHNHPDWYGYSADKFVAEMDRWGIDRCWLLTWDTPENEVDPAQFNLLNEGPYRTGEGPIPLWRCLAFKEKYPDRFIVGYAPDPRRPDAIDNLEAAIALYDIQVCGEIKVRMIYDNPDAVEYFRFCGEKKLPVTLHFENPISTGRKYPRRSYWYGGDMDTLERLLQKCPDTKFLGMLWDFGAQFPEILREKTFTIPTDRYFRADEFRSCFGVIRTCIAIFLHAPAEMHCSEILPLQKSF